MFPDLSHFIVPVGAPETPPLKVEVHELLETVAALARAAIPNDGS